MSVKKAMNGVIYSPLRSMVVSTYKKAIIFWRMIN